MTSYLSFSLDIFFSPFAAIYQGEKKKHSESRPILCIFSFLLYIILHPHQCVAHFYTFLIRIYGFFDSARIMVGDILYMRLERLVVYVNAWYVIWIQIMVRILWKLSTKGCSYVGVIFQCYAMLKYIETSLLECSLHSFDDTRSNEFNIQINSTYWF